MYSFTEIVIRKLMLVVFSPVVTCDIDHCATCKTDDNTK